MHRISFLLSALCFVLVANAQLPTYDSGGPLQPEQAAYDVSYYGLSVQVFP